MNYVFEQSLELRAFLILLSAPSISFATVLTITLDYIFFKFHYNLLLWFHKVGKFFKFKSILDSKVVPIWSSD